MKFTIDLNEAQKSSDFDSTKSLKAMKDLCASSEKTLAQAYEEVAKLFVIEDEKTKVVNVGNKVRVITTFNCNKEAELDDARATLSKALSKEPYFVSVDIVGQNVIEVMIDLPIVDVFITRVTK